MRNSITTGYIGLSMPADKAYANTAKGDSTGSGDYRSAGFEISDACHPIRMKKQPIVIINRNLKAIVIRMVRIETQTNCKSPTPRASLMG